MFARSLLLSLFVAVPGLAAVTITSVTPSSGPTTGGTVVIIRGTEFSERIGSPSLPPGVLFGHTLATHVELLDETTIRVIAPAGLPGVVAVSVSGGDGSATLANAYTYLADNGDDRFERILLPLLTPPVTGAFGSEFHTVFLADSSRSPDRRVEIYGLAEVCPPPPRVCGVPDVMAPLVIPSAEAGPLRVVMNGTPGRFIYVPEAQLDRLSLHLRVHDISRAHLNFGTEMPIVREREFTAGRLILLGVPADARFRNTLRLYSTSPTTLRVTVDGQAPLDVQLTGGRDRFEPAYAAVTPFVSGAEAFNIVVEHTPNAPAVASPPFWAFVTVTNNESQAITTIAPRP